MTCSENVQAGTGNIVITHTGVGTFESIPISDPRVSIVGNTITINPTGTFASLTNYHVTIAAGVIEDTSGNDFAGILNATDWNFTTLDNVAPNITAFNPADNAIGVAIGANLVITFNEPVDVETGNIIIRRISDNIAVHTIDVTSGLVTGTGTNTITINPPTDLDSLTAYYVEIDGTAFDDTSGNSFAGISGNIIWNFTTADAGAPTISILSPADDSTGVSVGANLIITFSEPVDVETGNIIIRRISDNVAVHTIDVTSGLVTGTGTNTITINPPTDLASLTAYYVEIDNTAFDDPASNSFTGISGNSTWNFITSGNSAGWYSSNWSRRIKITVNSTQVGSDLNNFPVYVDLSDLAPSFFANTQTDGSDIRVTLNDGLTAVPHELVNINTGGSTGELYFRATNLSSTVDNDFYIYYDNPNARMINGADELGFQKVWSNNYVAVYHMQQLPGNSNAKLWDSTANRNHGIPNGGMINANLVTGNTGGALDFDGSDDYLQIIDSASLNSASGTGQPRSVSYWLNTLETGNTVIMEKGSNSSFTQKTDTGAVIAGTNTTQTDYANTSVLINDGSWHFITHSYTGTANNVYVDGGGVPQGTSLEIAPAANTNPLTIGASVGGANAYDGLLDEIRISNVERSPEWIDAEYVNINTPGTFYSVAAEELVTDTSDPKITSLYSANKSVQHPISHNLKIFFSEVVNTNTGFMTIHRSFDDSVFEALDVTNGARVVGSGTSEITLIPTTNFEEGTKYYVLIDPTAIEDASSNAFSGIFDKETWTFTTQGRNSIKKQQLFILDGN